MSTIFPSPARIYFKSKLGIAFLSFGVATGDFDNSPLVTQPQAAHTIQSFPRSCRLFSPHPLLSSQNIFAAQSAGSSQVSFLEAAFQHRGTSRRCQRPTKQYSRNQRRASKSCGLTSLSLLSQVTLLLFQSIDAERPERWAQTQRDQRVCFC